MGWRKLVLIKYYYKMSDVNEGVPFKHLNRGALLWMVLVLIGYIGYQFFIYYN